MKKTNSFLTIVGMAVALMLLALPAGAYDKYGPADTKCQMKYNLKGWSFGVKMQRGEGRITCSNGQKAEVDLAANAIGFTIGKGETLGGTASFSAVKGIEDLFGDYGQLEAHAGMVESAEARVLTKGEVSMAFGGTGQGVDLGATIGAFRIEPQ